MCTFVGRMMLFTSRRGPGLGHAHGHQQQYQADVECCGSLGSSRSHRQHTGQHVVLVHGVQPDSRDSDAVWRPKVGRSIIFPTTTTTLGDYDTAVAPDPAAVDAIGRDPACRRAGRMIEFIYTLADGVT